MHHLTLRMENKMSPAHNMGQTDVYVVFECCILEIEDEMSTKLLLCAGVKTEDIVCGAFNPINFHQLVTNILSTHTLHLMQKRPQDNIK